MHIHSNVHHLHSQNIIVSSGSVQFELKINYSLTKLQLMAKNDILVNKSSTDHRSKYHTNSLTLSTACLLAGRQCKDRLITLGLNRQRDETAVLGNVSFQNVRARTENAFEPRTV